MPQDVSGDIDLSYLVDSTQADASDVTIPFNDVIGVINDILNGDQVAAQLVVDGGADEVQLTVEANASQTDNIVEINDSSGSQLLYVDDEGVPYSNGQGGPLGGGASPLVNALYVASRGQQLFANGSGLLGNNYNMSSATFDPAETHGGGGSFLKNVAASSMFSNEYIPVDISRIFELSLWGKSGEAGGANYNAANQQYVGLAYYDIDRNLILPQHYKIYTGSTETTLAADLNNGDSTVSLTDATGWYNSTNANNRHFIWYPYTNSLGNSYPDYTYSRNTAGDYYAGWQSTGVWGSGGISGNTITLVSNWTGPTIPAGTKVANTIGGGTYQYILAAAAVPNDWTQYSGIIGGIYPDTLPQADAHFPFGAAFMRLVFLVNYHGSADNNIRWSDIWLSEGGLKVPTDALKLPQLTTTERNLLVPDGGWLIFNTTTSKAQVYNGSTWADLH